MNPDPAEETREDLPLTEFLRDLAAVGPKVAVARVERAGEIRRASMGSGVGSDSWFDLASVTKPFVATLALRLDAVGDLPLSTRVGDVLAGAGSPLADRPLEDLLSHRSGLRAWLPFYALQGSRPIDRVLDPGSQGAAVPTYSDLGYLLWGWVAERETGRPLAELVRKHVLDPIGAGEEIAAWPGDRPGVVPCRLDNRVEVRLGAELEVAIEEERVERRGVPQDGNARFLGAPGELLGHCGLFGSARGLARLGTAWLGGELIGEALRERALSTESRYGLGWWRPHEGSEMTEALSDGAFGMVGFTGGSIWIDPERGLVAVLLTHREDSGFDLAPWRRRFHELAIEGT